MKSPSFARRIIVFSTKGKLYEFSTDVSMERILERYERCSSYSESERKLTAAIDHGSWTLEHAKLNSRMELLQTAQRHIIGEDLDSLSLKELQNLEQQLDTGLKHIRLRRNQLMLESISMLQKKVKEVEKEVVAEQPPVEPHDHHNMSSFRYDTCISAAYQTVGDKLNHQ